MTKKPKSKPAKKTSKTVNEKTGGIPDFLKRDKNNKAPIMTEENEAAFKKLKEKEDKSAALKAKKEKAEKKVASPPASTKKVDVVKDIFGYNVKSKTSQAAAMYMNGGSTTEEVKKKFGSPHLNLLKKVVELGHTFVKVKTDSKNGRKIYKYTIKINKKAKAG